MSEGSPTSHNHGGTSQNSSADNEANIPAERLALLQQMYQQKQLELLSHFERAKQNLAMQHLQNYYQSVQALQSQAPATTSQSSSEMMDESDGPAVPLQLASSMSSLLGTSASVPQTPSTSKDVHPLAAAAHHRSRTDLRSLGGSQTISQHTKDRLKNMIASRRSGDGSQTNLNQNGGAGSGSGGSQQWTPTQNAPMSPQIAVSSPHFEPYPLPSAHHTTNAGGGGAIGTHSHLPEYQLRKVNSEPNLKMRIRAKLLSKGSSPVHNNQSQQQQQQQQQQPSYHGTLQRSDSDAGGSAAPSTSISDRIMASASSGTAFPPHLIMPSPSLPNLNMASPNNVGAGLQVDMASLLAQAAQLNSFLSLPSLLKTQLGMGGSMGILDDSDKSRLDPRIAGLSAALSSGQLPIGGYPSLLKQQLRELVLRRKSLVREEPEEAVAALEEASNLVKSVSQETIEAREDSQFPSTGLAYDIAMSRHECVCGDSASHVEHGGRVQSIWARLTALGLVQRCEKVTAKKASLEALRMVHSPTYVTFFAVSPTACLKMEPSELPLKSFVQLPCGGIGVDSDTYFNDASTQQAARIAAGSLIELASQVAEGRLQNGFACIRPPGHHAEKDQAMGFCFFNNVAVTARHLQQRYPEQCQRIAIIDWDVHHGNGTQLCFEDDPNVLYISLHRHDNGNFFPGTGAVTEVGEGAGKGFTVNIPFSGDVMRDADYLAAWRVLVGPVLDHFQPSFILVSAGFDACKGHPNALGGYEISAPMFGFMTRHLLNYANGKVVLALEGGYDLTAISDAAEHCVRVLCGVDDDAGRLTADALEGIPCVSAQETIQKVIAIHKKHWPTLTAHQGINTSELQWQQLSREMQNMKVHN